MGKAEIKKSNPAFKAEIVSNEPEGADHFLIALNPIEGENPKPPKPGQFYMLGCGPSDDPLLKRPLCHFRIREGALEFLYRVHGRGTKLLSKLGKGATIDVLGPVGTPWPKPKRGTTPVVIAGGTGLASVFPLIESLKGKAVVFYGSRCDEEILFEKELRALSAELHIATDDGTCGLKGNVTHLMADYELTLAHTIYTCGPEVMLRAVMARVKDSGAKGYASLEAFMACGIGACMGCVVETTKGYKRVCKEGPVFKFEDLELEDKS